MVIFRFALYSIALAAICIGASIFIFGSGATGNFFSDMLFRATRLGGPLNDLSSPNVDSELRFYAVFWISYGVIALNVARQLPQTMKTAQLLLGLFFAGGAGRLLSVFSVGWPDPIFAVLMWIELGVPIALIGLSMLIQRGPD